MEEKKPNYIYEVKDVSLATGATSNSVAVSLREGKCVGIRFEAFQNTTPAHSINIGIEDNSGSRVADKIDFRALKGEGNNDFHELTFRANGQVDIVLAASQAISGSDFKGQLIFKIDINCKN